MKIKQFNFGPRFGALKVQAASAQFYVGLFQLGLIAAAAIRTMQEWFPWLTFPMLAVGLFVLYLLAMLFDYVFVLSSSTEFSTKQAYGHKNPAGEALEELKAGMKKVKDKLEIEDEVVE